MAIDENTPLKGKQPAFVDFYFICDFNGTEAARRAGYKGSDNTLAAVAYENLRKPHIAAEIQRRIKTRGMEADEVIMRLSDQARGSMAFFLNFDGRQVAIDLHQANELGKLNLVRKYKQVDTVIGSGDEEVVMNRRIEIELYNSQQSLAHLARVLGLMGATGTKEDPIHVEIPGLDDALEKIYGRPTDDNDTADNGRGGA
jgi:hypothetical protein